MTTEPSPKPSRPWRRAFRLRTLIVLIALLALPMAWLVNRSRTQRMAVEAIQQANGRVQYGHHYAGRDLIASDFEPTAGSDAPWGPEWLRRMIGDEPFQEVVYVKFRSGSGLDDQTVEAMTRLRGLQVVEISLDNEAQLARLRPIRHVPGLLIHGHEFGEPGLAIVAEFEHLRYLSIDHAAFDNASLGRIEKFKDLEYLHLYGDRIGDDGLAIVGRFPRLRSLILSGSRITDAGMARLGGLRDLRTLMISDTRVGDAGMDALVGLKRLDWLTLEGTQITDVGLAKLAELPNLTHLFVSRTKVTPAGIATIKARRPGLLGL